MTPFIPFEKQDRTATISLTKQEEAIVRLGYDPANAFQVQLVTRILEKLHGSLRATDWLRKPVTPAEKKAKPAVSNEPINLDLLEL